MTQFNLADELRRGGTGLLAQAVASLFESLCPSWSAAVWLADLQARAAAVPAGNQAKAPTALDEPAVLLGSHQCTPACPDSHRSNVELARELRETREALARAEAERDTSFSEQESVITRTTERLEAAEAERDECQARNNELIDAFRRADAESRELRRKFDSTHKLARDFGRHIDAVECENTKLHAVIEAARHVASAWEAGGYPGEPTVLVEALSALDQAASGPECAQKGHAYATNKGECCIYCFRPKAECLHMGEPASELR